ncbi:MAG: nitroreductase family protein [Acholeplasmatales bacterium]|nr:nitroreductase family protein [Acholeplasmatales bacterium]
MEYFEVINKRYSCREFKEERITREELNKILEAGNLAPTAVNFQPFKIFVIESDEILNLLSSATKYTFGAKTILCVAHNIKESWHRYKDQRDFGTFDSAIVTTQMVLAATSLGIGTCIVCSMDEEKVKNILGLGNEYIVDSLIPMGYPKNNGVHNKRKKLEEIVEYR